MKARRGLPLPLILAGIDGDQSRALEKLQSALDVINENGRLVRRGAWKTVGAAPVLHRPAGQVTVASNDAVLTGRVCSSTNVGADGYIYVGAATPFAGIEWGDITAADTTAAANRRLQVQYWTGSTWGNILPLLNTTNTHVVSRTGHVPLLRNGQIHIRIPSDWATTSVASTTLYWLRFRIVSVSSNGTPTATMTGISWTMVQPGVRVFDRAPVNGMHSGRIRGGFASILAADQPTRGPYEPGANVGRWDLGNASTSNLLLTDRTTSGFWGQVPHQAAGLYSDPRTTTTSGTTGTSGRFTDRGAFDQDDGYDALGYTVRRPLSALYLDVAPSATGTTSTFTTTDARLITLPNGALNHHWTQVTTAGGGPTLGLVREIVGFTVSGGVATITLSPALDAAPTTSTRFGVARPWTKLVAKSPTMVIPHAYNIGAINSATNLTPNTDNFSEAPTNRLGSAAHVHFEIAKQVRWNIAAGKRYNIVPDPLDGSLVICNGAGPPLRYDGVQLTLLKTAREDEPKVEAVLGVMPALGPNPKQDPRSIAYEAAFYRQPPSGKYWCVHNGAFFVAGLSGENDSANRQIRWSMPGTRRDLWPRWPNEAAIRDSTGNPIRGLSSYYDRVIAFTETSIHEGAPIPNGGYNFRQLAGSIGFTSHDAVKRAPLDGKDVLIGPAPDGLAAFSGGQPVYLIDRWDRVIPEGVDPASLFDAPGACWRQKGYYILALKRRGSTSRDRLLVYDYVNTRAWVFSAPWGASSLDIFTNAAGNEVLLVGTEDGLVTTLTGTQSDDGDTAISAFIKTHPIPLSPAGQEVRVVRITTQLIQPGLPPTLDVDIFRDEEADAWATGSFPVQPDPTQFATAVYGTDSYGAARGVKVASNVPAGTRCRDLSIQLGFAAETEIKTLAVEFDVLTQGR